MQSGQDPAAALQIEPEEPQSGSLLSLALDHFEKGNYEEAEPIFRESLKTLSGDDIMSGVVLSSLSTICAKRGDFKDAIRLSLLRVTVVQSTQGEDSQEALSAMLHLATLYERVGRYEESTDLHYRVKALQEKLIYSQTDEPEIGTADDTTGEKHSPLTTRLSYTAEPQGQSRTETDEERVDNELQQLLEEEERQRQSKKRSLLHEQDDQKGSPKSSYNSQFAEELRHQFRPEPEKSQVYTGPRVSSGDADKHSAARMRQLNLDNPDERTRAARALTQAGNALSLRQIIWAVSAFLKDHKNRYYLVLAAICIMVATLVYGLLQPRRGEPLDAYLSMPHQYRTIIGLPRLDLQNVSSCKLTVTADQTIEMPLRFYLGDWRDGAEIAVRSLFERQHWFYQEQDGLKETPGSFYLPVNGKVDALVQEGQALARGANDYYHAHGSYPNQLSALVPALYDGVYPNPFTNRDEHPRFLAPLTLPKQASLDQAHQRLQELYASLRGGMILHDRNAMEPGEICLTEVTVPSAQDRSMHAIVIEIGDDNGHPYLCDVPHSYFFLSSENGNELTSIEPASNHSLPLIEGAYLIQSGSNQFVLLLWRYSVSIALTAMGIILFLLSRFFRSSRTARSLHMIALVSAVILAVAYFCKQCM